MFQVSFSDQNISVVRRRNRRCRKFCTFSSSSEPLDQFHPNLALSILECLFMLFPRRDNNEIAKINL